MLFIHIYICTVHVGMSVSTLRATTAKKSLFLYTYVAQKADSDVSFSAFKF